MLKLQQDEPQAGELQDPRNMCTICGKLGHARAKCKSKQQNQGSAKPDQTRHNVQKQKNTTFEADTKSELMTKNKKCYIQIKSATRHRLNNHSHQEKHRNATQATNSYTYLNASFQGRTRVIKALIANRLSHDMIQSWQDCIQLRIVPKTFPPPLNLGEMNEIHNKAEEIKKTITNKFEIIQDDISTNKILMDPTK